MRERRLPSGGFGLGNFHDRVVVVRADRIEVKIDPSASWQELHGEITEGSEDIRPKLKKVLRRSLLGEEEPPEFEVELLAFGHAVQIRHKVDGNVIRLDLARQDIYEGVNDLFSQIFEIDGLIMNSVDRDDGHFNLLGDGMVSRYHRLTK